jgi:hypothetical protein
MEGRTWNGVVLATKLLIWRPCTGIHISVDNKVIFLTPCDFTQLDYHTSNVVRLLVGYGPLWCIALEAAPRFVAIVAASILKVVDEPWARYLSPDVEKN